MGTFGFDTMTTYLVQAPSYSIAYAAAFGIAYSSSRFQESHVYIIIQIVVSAKGAYISIATLNHGARYFGLGLLISGAYSRLNLQLSWATSLLPHPRKKKASLIAIASAISQVSYWFISQFSPTSQEPDYRLGGGLVLLGCMYVVIMSLLIVCRAKVLNKKLDEAEGGRNIRAMKEAGDMYTKR